MVLKNEKYPRMKIRGPIEAQAGGSGAYLPRPYPRMKIRGPIEAGVSTKSEQIVQRIRG